jgi:hypothetical protein
MRYLLAVLSALLAHSALAAIDYTCLDRCTRQNYQYQYCQEVCSYNTTPTPPAPPPVYYPGPSRTNAAIARGVPGINLGGTLGAIAAMKMQQQQIDLQREQMAAQQRYAADQARAQQFADQRQAAEAVQAGSGPEANGRDRAAFVKWANAVAARKHLFPDFERVVFQEDVEISVPMVELLAESDYAADVTYHLGTNKAEAARIARLPFLDQAVAIKEIEKQVRAKQ